MKNIYFFMCMSLSGLALHACDDGDRKNDVAAVEDADQKKITAAFNILFDMRTKTYGPGLPNDLGKKAVGMVEVWQQHSITRSQVDAAKFFDKAGILCSRKQVRSAALLDFVDCRGKSVELLDFSEEGHVDLRFSTCEHARVPLLAAYREKLDILNLDTLEPKGSVHQRERLQAVEFAQDGTKLMTAFCYSLSSASVNVLDVETAQSLVSFTDDGYLQSAKLSPEGGYIALGTDNAHRKDIHRVRIFDIRAPKSAARELVCSSCISDMRFIKNDKELVVAEIAPDGAITTWDLSNCLKKQIIKQSAEHIAVDAAGDRLVSGGVLSGKPENCVFLWELATGNKIASFHTGNNGAFKACDISADGNAILAVPKERFASPLKVWTKVPLKQQLGELQARRIVQGRRKAGDSAS